MTKTASKELCAELYKLTGWWDIDFMYEPEGHVQLRKPSNQTELQSYVNLGRTPAYSCGYLLRKLPAHISIELQKRVEYDGGWSWNLVAQSPDGFYWVEDGFLEDLTAQLCIELVKQGILQRGTQE